MRWILMGAATLMLFPAAAADVDPPLHRVPVASLAEQGEAVPSSSKDRLIRAAQILCDHPQPFDRVHALLEAFWDDAEIREMSDETAATGRCHRF